MFDAPAALGNKHDVPNTIKVDLKISFEAASTTSGGILFHDTTIRTGNDEV